MVGLETAYSVVQEVLIDSGDSNFTRLAEVMSINGARISGLSGQGTYLEPGQKANLALVNPGLSWSPEPKTQSMSENNPYSGLEMKGRVVHTIYDGEFSYRNFQIVQRASV
jgi:dihydroorotase